MEKNLVFLAIAVLLLAARVNALDCEKNTISIRADSGNYAYGETECTSDSSLTAYYDGNLSESVKVYAEKKGTDRYMISMIADVRNANAGIYKGVINLKDADGNEYALTTRVLIGETTEDVISLSSQSISFEINQLNKTECSPVEITNSGNSDLANLRVECVTESIVSPEYGNNTWITLNDISEQSFSPGEKKTLKICVNTDSDHPNLQERNTKIAVYADSSSDQAGPKVIRNDISVTLTANLDTIWKEKYDQLNDQHQMLQKAYNGLAAYRTALQNAEGNTTANISDPSTYTGLTKIYGDLKKSYSETEKKINDSEPSAIESLKWQYANLAENYSILQTGYANLAVTISSKVDNETIKNLTKERDTAKAEMDGIQKEIEGLRSQADEKDATLALMSRNISPDKSPGNKTPVAGYAVSSLQEYTPYIPAILIAFIAIPAAYFLIKKYKKRNCKKDAIIMASIEKDAKEVEKEEKLPDQEALKQKEQQKDALRQLLLQKLTEKAAEKK